MPLAASLDIACRPSSTIDAARRHSRRSSRLAETLSLAAAYAPLGGAFRRDARRRAASRLHLLRPRRSRESAIAYSTPGDAMSRPFHRRFNESIICYYPRPQPAPPAPRDDARHFPALIEFARGHGRAPMSALSTQTVYVGPATHFIEGRSEPPFPFFRQPIFHIDAAIPEWSSSLSPRFETKVDESKKSTGLGVATARWRRRS